MTQPPIAEDTRQTLALKNVANFAEYAKARLAPHVAGDLQIVVELARQASQLAGVVGERDALREALRHAQGRFLNINICLSSGGSKREAITIADVGEDCVKMALDRAALGAKL